MVSISAFTVGIWTVPHMTFGKTKVWRITWAPLRIKTVFERHRVPYLLRRKLDFGEVSTVKKFLTLA